MATGDQTLINFPRDTTLQNIAQSLQTIAFTQAANLEKYFKLGSDQRAFPERICSENL